MRYLGLLWMLLVVCPFPCVAQDKLGEVRKAERTVGWPAGGGVSKVLKEGGEILDEMKVTTQRKGRAEILLTIPDIKSGTVTMGGNTELTFYKELAKGVLKTRLFLGRCFALFMPDSPDNEKIITIETPSGLLRLLGTAVFVDVARDGSTSLFVLEGTVLVEPKAGGAPFKVPADKWTFIAAGGQHTDPAPFGMVSERGPNPRVVGDAWLSEPPQILFDGTRLSLPK